MSFSQEHTPGGNFSRQRPSSWWYSLCVVLALIPFGIGAFYFVHELFHLTDGLVQVVVPGSAELKFDRAGTNTVFLEEESVINGKIYASADSVDGLKCSVHSQNGSAIELTRPGASTNYTLGGRRGRSVLEFSAPAPGTYHFQRGYEDGRKEPETVVAVGSGVAAGIIRSLVAAFLGIGAGLSVGVISFLVIYRLQRRSARMAPRASPNYSGSPSE